MISETKLKEVLSSVLNVPVAEINDDFNSDKFEQWDSLKHMNLILALEEEFNVEIPDEEVGNLTSYKLIKLVLNDLA